MASQKQVEIGETTYAVRPRTILVDAELSPGRGALRGIDQETLMVQVAVMGHQAQLAVLAAAEPIDLDAVRAVAAEITECEMQMDEIGTRRQLAIIGMVDVMLVDGPGLEALSGTLDLLTIDAVSVAVGLVPPTEPSSIYDATPASSE